MVFNFLNIWPTVLLYSIPAAKPLHTDFAARWKQILPGLPGMLCASWQCRTDEAGTDLERGWDREQRNRKFCHMARSKSPKN